MVDRKVPKKNYGPIPDREDSSLWSEFYSAEPAVEYHMVGWYQGRGKSIAKTYRSSLELRSSVRPHHRFRPSRLSKCQCGA
jgi:hypothetical protein